MADAEFVIAARFDTTDMDAQIAEQQERLRTAFNRIPGMPKAETFEEARGRINQESDVGMGTLRGQAPAFGRAVNSYNTFAMTGSTQDQINQQSRQDKQQGMALNRQMYQQKRQSLQLAQQEYVNRVKAISTFGALLTGNPMMALQNWAMTSVVGALAGPRTMSGSASQAVQAAAGGTSGSTGPVSALASAIGSIVRTVLGGSTGETEAEQLQATQEEQQKVAQEEQPTQQLSSGPGNILGGIISAIPGGSDVLKATGAVAGIGIAINEIMAQAAQTAQQLQANVAGPAGTQNTLRSEAEASVGGFKGGFNYQQIADTYSQLGNLGVRRPELEQGNLGNISLAMGTLSGLPQDQVNSLTAALNVQGKMSPTAIGAFYDSVYRGADKMGVSLTQLVGTMQSFEKETGNAGLSLAGAQNLISLQGYLGRGVDAGAVAGNLASATGPNLMKLSAFTGKSIDTVLNEQQNNSGLLFEQYTDTIARITAGQKDTGKRVAMAESVDTGMGNYLGNAMNSTQQAQFWAQRFGPNGLTYTQWTAQHPLTGGTASDLVKTGETAKGATTDAKTQALNILQAITAQKGGSMLDNLERYKQHPEDLAKDLGTYLKNQPADMWTQLNQGWPMSPGDLGNVKDTITGAAGSLKDDVIAGGTSFSQDVEKAGSDFLSLFSPGGAHATGEPAAGGTNQPYVPGSGNPAMGGGLNSATPYAGNSAVNPYTGGPKGGGDAGSGTKASSLSVAPVSGPHGTAAVPADVLRADEVAANGDPNWLKLLLAQQYMESTFKASAVSNTGLPGADAHAYGIAQFLPSTAATLAADKNSPLKGKPFDTSNVQESAIMEKFDLQKLLQDTRSGGTMAGALGGYYGDWATGPGSYAASVQQVEHVITIRDQTASGIQHTIETSKKNLGSSAQGGRHAMPAPQTKLFTRHNTGNMR